jgi:hypothetical protein
LRLWSIHPKYLDAVGLVALWRETLLAQKVLKGETEGFKNLPQLKRFKMHVSPHKAIANYLLGIWEESKRRGYHFDKRKIKTRYDETDKIPVTRGQLRYEFDWLSDKLKKRDRKRYDRLGCITEIECHPAFEVIEGEVEEWEKVKPDISGKYASFSKISLWE